MVVPTCADSPTYTLETSTSHTVAAPPQTPPSGIAAAETAEGVMP